MQFIGEEMTRVEEVDEIKDYYDCRYLFACEAAWRIYGFEIHYRTPRVERLPFHLQDEHFVLFDATDSIDFTLEKESVNETKFIQWMELNKTDTFSRTLLYGLEEWSDQRKYDDVVYSTNRDACYARDSMSRLEVVWKKTWHLMADDVEFVERIKQNDP
nr:putative PIF1 DNA helicase/replication protein A1-like protein [Tanacetum cinerariifolium]